MAKLTAEVLNKVSSTWVQAPKGCELFECFKCAGNGKYSYQDGSQGVCYACNGAKLLPNNEAKEAKRRHITQVSFDVDTEILHVYYLAYNVATQELEGWKKEYEVSKMSEELKQTARAIYHLGKTRN